jgi:hypothetical protein
LDQVGGQVRGQVGDQVRGAIWGQHDANWLAFYDYFRRACNLTVCDRLNGLSAVAKSAGWWWAMRGAVVLTERPRLLHRDNQFRLHHDSGPALSYPDGWGIWAWHGTRVPRELIEGERWSLARILRERNSEIRRAAIEKTGWEHLESQLGVPVATCPDPGNPGRTLALHEVPDGLYEIPVRLVLMTNGSPDRSGAERRYGETVPADITDPVAAQAWAYGIPGATYAACQRRT